VVCQHGEGETRITSLVLYRINSNKRMQCFYRVDVQPNQFGEGCLIREWRRIGRGGLTRSLPFLTPELAQTALHRSGC
jgi:predicted DNA-binding WGR domain protein